MDIHFRKVTPEDGLSGSPVAVLGKARSPGLTRRRGEGAKHARSVPICLGWEAGHFSNEKTLSFPVPGSVSAIRPRCTETNSPRALFNNKMPRSG